MTAHHLTLEIPATPDRADRDFIHARLVESETAQAGPLNLQPLAILIKGADGSMRGGLWGNTVFRWLVVELLFVPEDARGSGLGRRIMARAEAVARERDCIGIWLDTYSFQAPGFYAKLGFEIVGQIDDQPPGATRFFMQKRWSHP